MDEVVRVATGDEIARRTEADEARVAPDDLCLAGAIAGARAQHEMQILNLTLSLVRLAALGCRCHGNACSCPFRWGASPSVDSAAQ